MDKFATGADYEECRKIHRQFGTTYYFATLRFPAAIRRRVHAVYAFVRVPDEWVDNPGDLTPQDRAELLDDWRRQLHAGLAGERPDHFALRAFVDVIHECGLPVEEADLFIDAMAMDVWRTRYETYDDLCQYMRGSASAVGVMMCYAMDARPDGFTLARAHALGEAMQMTNFLRDIGEDADRGRIYIPLEDLRAHGLTEQDLLDKRYSPAFRELMRFEICRARKLYFHSDMGLPHLPGRMQRAVMLARLLYAQILDRIEEQEHNVFVKRARTNLPQKLRCAARVATRSRRILAKMVAGPTH